MAWTTTDKHWSEKLKIVQQENETLKQQLLEKFKKEYEQNEEEGRARTRLQISQGRSPNEQFKASPSDREYYDKVYEKLKINKEAGKDPVDVFKDGIQGELFSELPSSKTIRSRLAPFTTGGPAPYDKEGGSMRGVTNPILRKILLKDAMAGAPRYIRSGPPPNVINKAPHIDSLFIDRMLRDYRNKQEPQLPSFV